MIKVDLNSQNSSNDPRPKVKSNFCPKPKRNFEEYLKEAHNGQGITERDVREIEKRSPHEFFA